MEAISSLQNSKVKLVHALQQRSRTRHKEGLIVLEGERLIRDACASGQQPQFVLYDPQTVNAERIAWLAKHTADLTPITEKVMRHLSDTQQPPGLMAVFPLPTPTVPQNLARILILDAIRDPGNLGTMLRTAAAAGIQVVFLAPECADPYNPKVLRSGMGAHFRVPVIGATWEQLAEYSEACAIYLADSQGEQPYHAVDWTLPWALIIGSEAHGASPAAFDLAHTSLTIPMAADTESLNAAIATGVILFEAQRQRITTT
jgi:RNA methyltransferase, TrmH family